MMPLVTSFFADHGIIYQTSCVKRPQQNARAKRKHRHILEISRGLRFQGGLPQSYSYWGDCILTAVHLINRLPTPVLNNITPYEALFGTKPSYDHLKFFGCLAFATNPAFSTDKFYPSTQKGYKPLNLITMQLFVSRDVRFHESILPFLTVLYAPHT